MHRETLALKNKVCKVLGQNGVMQCSVIISLDEPIEYRCRWQRSYPDAGLSDERPEIQGSSLYSIFLKILDYEQRADEKDVENTKSSNEEVSRSMF